MKEIVTIQVGNYANFVGSHFWNFQDELLGLTDIPDSDQIFRNHGLNMDVLYRTGETQQGILTYTPRVVSVDFQGSLGSVSSNGTLYNDVPETSVDTLTWSCNNSYISTFEEELILARSVPGSVGSVEEDANLGSSSGCESKNSNSHTEVQDKDIVECLENGVQYWTDFSKVHYHPQSLYELRSDVKDCNIYGIGKESFSGGLAEEINERLRFFVEECDLPQGFQVIIDDSGGLSGVAGEFLENIADEYANIPVILYSVRSPDLCTDSGSRKLAISRKLHDAVSFSKLSAFCKLIVPVGLPSLNACRMSKYLCLDDRKPYHTSAVYASGIHSISLPFRMQPFGPSAQSSYTSGAVNIKELVQMLAGQGRQNMVTVLDVAMPAPAFTGMQAQQHLLDNLQPLTPEISEDVEDMQALETMTIHGAFASGSKRASISEVKDAIQTPYLNALEKPKFSHLSIARCPLPIPLPFPSIFGKLVGRHGELLDSSISDSVSRGSLEVHSVPMAARLRSSNAVLPFLKNRLESLRKFGVARGALGTELLTSWGFGKEDVEELGETLYNIVTTLNPASRVSSDSD